jgi:hypothetical protein
MICDTETGSSLKEIRFFKKAAAFMLEHEISGYNLNVNALGY